MTYPFFLKKFLVRSGIARFLPVTRRLTRGANSYIRYYSDRIIAAPIEKLLDPIHFPPSHDHLIINLNQPAPSFESPVSGGAIAADRLGNSPPFGLPALRETLSERYRSRDGRSLDASEEILLTHGATGAFAAALDSFVNPGDRVVLFDPCSPMFMLGAESRRARINWVPTKVEGGRLRFDPNIFRRAMSGAMMLVVADPGNLYLSHRRAGVRNGEFRATVDSRLYFELIASWTIGCT